MGAEDPNWISLQLSIMLTFIYYADFEIILYLSIHTGIISCFLVIQNIFCF